MTYLEKIARWNLWSGADLDTGIKRDITPRVLDSIPIPETIVLTGPRRTGKSTILYQVMRHLIAMGTDPKAILHINFEDPALALDLGLTLLDSIYDEYRNQIFPQGKAYIFLDEIQRITAWERWVRARNESENIKIFITGSSAQLMSRELGTVLTGRHLSFKVLPLSFAEFLRFNELELRTNFYGNRPPAIIGNALARYLKWGGYPRIALLGANDGLKRDILLEYFDDMLFRDVTMRHQVRDVNLLRNLAIHCLTQTSCQITAKRLADLLLATTEAMQTYCGYLQEAYFFELLACFSLKVAERNRNPYKLHAVDLGLRNILAISNSIDIGKNVETVVHNNLRTDTLDNIYYYKDQNTEIDLLVHRNNQVTQLIQIMNDGLNIPKTLNREIKSLQQAMARYPEAQAKLIVNEFPINWEPSAELAKSKIQIIPLWKFLLGAAT